jgi:hypothetical protein
LGEEPYLIDEATIVSGSGGSTWNLNFSLTRPEQDWPAGNYRFIVKVQTDNAKPVPVDFRVE